MRGCGWGGGGGVGWVGTSNCEVRAEARVRVRVEGGGAAGGKGGGSDPSCLQGLKTPYSGYMRLPGHLNFSIPMRVSGLRLGHLRRDPTFKPLSLGRLLPARASLFVGCAAALLPFSQAARPTYPDC